ncbi:hypothetical protein MRB53_034444 [Persea americana]|uniref:Uncharacterized protein n=1 Tax=Persea americana TaxID=3435 RepID=A0ACC2K1S4_PERAE|nr:hypothetical protein MRB53_034444 [Persea americana]
MNVQLQPEFLVNEVFPPSPPHIVHMGVEETVSLAVSSPTPIISDSVEEASVPEEFLLVPLVHTEAVGNTEDIQIVKHPPAVHEGLHVNTINDPTNVQLQPEETSEARLIVHEGDETVQFPSTKLGDTTLQAKTIDPFINKEAASTEQLPIAVNSGEMILEPPAQFSEVQDQLPLKSTSQLEAEGDQSNTIASELPAVPEPSTAMHGIGL